MKLINALRLAFITIKNYIDTTLSLKLDIHQGAENSGKIMGVDEEGDLVPVDNNIDLSDYETIENAQVKYDTLTSSKADKEHNHSWNELNDRPFGEVSEYILNWSGVVTKYDEWVNSLSDYNVIIDPSKLKVGETYTLSFNGSTVNANCTSIYMTQVIGFKNVAFDGGYKIEYQIQPSNPNYGSFLVYNDNWRNNSDLPESLDVTFTIAKSTVKQIPIEYIPDELMDEAKSYTDTEIDEFLENKANKKS